MTTPFFKGMGELKKTADAKASKGIRGQRKRPLMASHIFRPFLTYLPTLSYSVMSHFGGYLGPLTYPNIGRH